MTRIEMSEAGLQKLSARIDRLQDRTAQGILNPPAALRYLHEIRTGLFELRQIIRGECVFIPGEDPHGSDAA